jgi:hypothetical protein
MCRYATVLLQRTVLLLLKRSERDEAQDEESSLVDNIKERKGKKVRQVMVSFSVNLLKCAIHSVPRAKDQTGPRPRPIYTKYNKKRPLFVQSYCSDALHAQTLCDCV